MKKTTMLLSFLLIIGSLLAACQPAQPTETSVSEDLNTPPVTICTGITSNDKVLVEATIRKLPLPYYVGKPYPVLTREQFLEYFSFVGVDPNQLVVDCADLVTIQIEPVANGNGGFIPFTGCNPTDRKFDGWRSSHQPDGVILNISQQQGFPTGFSLLEGASFAPNPDGSLINAVTGVCP